MFSVSSVTIFLDFSIPECQKLDCFFCCMLQQTTCISDLPDVAPPGPGSGLAQGFFRGQNGSIRCNGRALGTRNSHHAIHLDSSSCSSKEGSLDDPKGRWNSLTSLSSFVTICHANLASLSQMKEIP